MPVFDSIILLVIEFLCGACGGYAIGQSMRNGGLGSPANVLTGGMGGLLLTWLAARIPGVGRYLGYVETVADAMMQGSGGLTPAILIGVGIAGLIGGIVLTALACFLKSRIVE